MKLIINTSTLSASGVTQVSISFIYECLKFPENEYHIFMSATLMGQIDEKDFTPNFFFYKINNHPLYGIKGIRERRRLRKLTKDINADVMFSVFGPSCFTPNIPHLQGYAYPHYVYPESPLFDRLSFSQKLKIKFREKLHLAFLNRNGDFYVSETEDVSNRLEKLIHKKGKKYFTVSNTVSAFFYDYKDSIEKRQGLESLLPLRKNNEFRFIILCTYHLHKNLEILNEVVPILKQRAPNLNIKFVTTILDREMDTVFSPEAKKSIINLGRVPVKDCPKLYDECDALFLPTLLECFSANYPEAMMMNKPILTSNLTFATEVCGDAALYFNPINASDIVEKILELVNNSSLRENLVENGALVLNNFETAHSRAKKYLDICENIRK